MTEEKEVKAGDITIDGIPLDSLLEDTQKSKIENEDLSHVDFTDVQINNTEFNEVELIHADLSSVCIKNCTFDNVDLTNANLRYSILEDVGFISCKLDNITTKDTTFTGSTINYSEISNCEMDMSEFASCIIAETEIAETELPNYRDTEIDQVTFIGTTFSGYMEHTEIVDSKINQCTIKDAKLDQGEISKTNISEAVFINTDFKDMDITHSRYYDCEFRQLSFNNSKMDNCKFKNSLFEQPHFYGGTAICETDFVHTSFNDAVWGSGVELVEVEFRKCELTDCKFESTRRIESVLFNKKSSLINVTLKRISDSSIVINLSDVRNMDIARSDINLHIDESELKDCTIEQSDIDEVDIYNSELNNVQVQNSILTGGRFFNANLNHTRFRNCDLKDVTVEDTNIEQTVIEDSCTTNMTGENAVIEIESCDFGEDTVPKGELIGWSPDIENNEISKIKIPEDSKRHSKIGSRKCVCTKATVEQIKKYNINENGAVLFGNTNPNDMEIHPPDNSSAGKNRLEVNTCEIEFFLTETEALQNLIVQNRD